MDGAEGDRSGAGQLLVIYETGHPDRTVTSVTQPGGWADWLSLARFDMDWVKSK